MSNMDKVRKIKLVTSSILIGVAILLVITGASELICGFPDVAPEWCPLIPIVPAFVGIVLLLTTGSKK
jgi:hypothetical protein